MTMAEERDLEKLSLEELAELLNYYSLYNTTKDTGKPRPSGPLLKKHLQRRLTRHGKDDPKPTKEPQVLLEVDLYVLHSEPSAGNLLLDIERTLTPYLHEGNKALRRKPKEYAREVMLALLEHRLVDNTGMELLLKLQLFEDKYEHNDYQTIRCRGVDWVVFTRTDPRNPNSRIKLN